MPARIVIAGAGLAGLRAAQAARGAGHEGEIVLIGDEPHAPYTRPPLSKELLKGEQAAADTAFPGLDVLEAELRLGVAVTAADTDAHTLTLQDGSNEAYDRLVVATGVRARPLPGTRADAVHTLRSLNDAARLLHALTDARRVAIVGAGFIGCEVAASLRHRAVEVDLIDQAPQPLLPLGPQLGGLVADLHRDHGVRLHLGRGVQAIEADSVTLDDGTRLDVDLVLVAVGSQANTDFLAQTGIELDDAGGIVCDRTLTSVSDPDVLAAGDIAVWPHLGAGGECIRVEHWTVAAEHGRLAGANATREPAERVAHAAPPYFWSDQYDRKIQVVGFPARAERIDIVEAEDGAGRLVAECHDARGELVAAVTFNNARRLAEYRRRLVAEHA